MYMRNTSDHDLHANNTVGSMCIDTSRQYATEYNDKNDTIQDETREKGHVFNLVPMGFFSFTGSCENER